MSRSVILLAAALATTTALSISVSACSGGDVSVGSTEQELKKKKDGGATGNGASCSWDDTVSSDGTTTPAPGGGYEIGDSFKSPDGCNDCSCTAQGIVCTMRACPPGGGGTGGSCVYDGKTYPEGAGFKSTDGCNSCSCGAGGMVACTEMACAPAPSACVVTGCSGEICADTNQPSPCLWTEAFACYKTATCARQADGACGWTPTADLNACLASKK